MAARYLSSEGDPDHDPSILKFSRIEEVEDTPVFQERVAYLEVRASNQAGGMGVVVPHTKCDGWRLFRSSLV